MEGQFQIFGNHAGTGDIPGFPVQPDRRRSRFKGGHPLSQECRHELGGRAGMKLKSGRLVNQQRLRPGKASEARRAERGG